MKNELEELAKKLISLDETVDVRDDSIEAYADLLLTNCINSKVEGRLKEKRETGRYGWWNPKEVTTEELRGYVGSSPIDKLIFSAMVELREKMDVIKAEE